MTEAPRNNLMDACELADQYNKKWLAAPDNSAEQEIMHAAESAATDIVIETAARTLHELKAKALLLRRNLEWSNVDGQLSRYSETRDYLTLSLIEDIITLHGEG